jgi:hypothetical protein
MYKLKDKLTTFIDIHFPPHNQDRRVYLEKSIEKAVDQFAYFYLLVKIHKTLWATCPIVLVSDS